MIDPVDYSETIALDDLSGEVRELINRLQQGGSQGLASITREEAELFPEAIRINTRGHQTSGLQGWFLPIDPARIDTDIDDPSISIERRLILVRILYERDILEITADIASDNQPVKQLVLLKKGPYQPDKMYSYPESHFQAYRDEQDPT